MPHIDQSTTLVEPLFTSPKVTCKILGIGSTTFWNWVKRDIITLVAYGRKRLVPYPVIKEVARKIEAGEIAPARKGFSAHEDAVAKSIAARRARKVGSTRGAAVGRAKRTGPHEL